MRLTQLEMFTWRRVLIGALAIGILLAATACGSSTPTPPPASPTLAALAQPTSGEAPVPPAATGPVETPPTLPTVGTPPVAATVATTATTASKPTRTPRPAGTSAPLPPAKPGALTGKIAYGVSLGGTDAKYRTINVANLNETTGGPILTAASWPAFSPDGSRIAYFNWTRGGLFIANSDGGGAQGPLVIAPGICCLDWSRDGKYIVYANSPKPLQPGGPISMLRVDVPFNPSNPAIVPLNVSGNGPAFSPDGKQIVWSGGPPNTNTLGLMISPTDGGGVIRILTHDNGGNAKWSPDGKKIVYQISDESGNHQVAVINADGAGGSKLLTSGKGNDGQPVWSRDGGSIIWRSDQNGTSWAIFAMNADGSNKRQLIPNVSPDSTLWAWESISIAP